MARFIEEGQSIFIPFKNGFSITDSQLHLRMYKTVEMFKRHFPKNTKYDVLCEYAPVVRCKDCRYCQHDARGFWCFNNYEHNLQPDDFCSYGERKDND